MRLRITTIAILFFAVYAFIPQIQAEDTLPTKNPAEEYVQDIFADYMDNLHNKLKSNWQPPDFMEEGHVKVYFKINKNGQVINAYIIESSGNDIYDESAIEAVNDCAPFGNFPESTSKEYIGVKYSFDTVLIEDERMNGYYELAKQNAQNNPRKALEYLNLAISQVGGEEASGFLYKRRAEIKKSLGDNKGAKEDYDTYKMYTNRANIKRIHLLKHLAETKNSAFIYHYLAYAYEQINDYENAILAIDKAIALTNYNGLLKRYKKTLILKQQAGEVSI